ncbi:MAG: hypothetical protein ACE5KF_01115 [Kiloniellaceae bacterium]
MPYLLIDPAETLDYTCDWSAFLDDGGSPSDTISTSSWRITPQTGSPQAPDLSGATNTTSTATIKVTGAALGQVYLLSNKIVTAQGLTAERSITLRCENR